MSSPFTCLACRVAFADGDIQRAHYKEDWHRYNLKRRVAQLPPVTADNFAERVKAHRQEEAEDAANSSQHCTVCNKHFNSQNAYKNHLQSKKHKENETKQQEKFRAEQEKLERKQAEKGLIPTDSDVAVVEKNLRNVAIKESTVQAGSSGSGEASKASAAGKAGSCREEDDEDMDTESVESWSGEALGLEECLFCSRVSKTLEKNVTHMTTTHSFFIPDVEFLVDLQGLITYLVEKVGEGNICLWCNEKGKSYRTTKAVQQHMVDKGHCKMLFEGDAVFEYSDFYDYRKSYPDYVEGERRLAEGEDEEEEEVETETAEEANYQLVLPSGSTLGHRALHRYYRQKLRPDRPHHLTPLNKLMSQYKALGWTGTTGAVAQLRAKDISYVRRQKQKYHMRLGCKAHKLVNHYRPQVVF